MLTLLLALFLNILQIDYSPSVLQQPVSTQQKIISHFFHNQYQPPYKIFRSLPPISRSPLVKPPILLTAKSAVVIDIMSGQVLYEKNTDFVLPIASLTKLMTAMVFLETNSDFSQEITIEDGDNNNVEGSRLYVLPGERMTVGDLFYASLVGSANNATKALARSTGLSEDDFLKRMNGKADNLGLTNTVFYDVTGLDPNNTSTVYEYSRVASYAFHNSLIKEALQRPEYVFTTLEKKISHRIHSTNQLLSDPELDLIGAKTGYIDEAGYTFVCQAVEDDHEVMAVLFKSSSSQARFAETKALIKWAFGNYSWF